MSVRIGGLEAGNHGEGTEIAGGRGPSQDDVEGIVRTGGNGDVRGC